MARDGSTDDAAGVGDDTRQVVRRTLIGLGVLALVVMGCRIAPAGASGLAVDDMQSLPGSGLPVARDVSGDGLADLPLVLVRGTRRRPSLHAVVILGRRGADPVDTRHPGNWGFTIRGAGAHPWVGLIGDMNGDGLAEIAVGRSHASGPAVVWIVFGSRRTDPVDVRALGDRGVRLVTARSGWSYGDPAGDVNGDGLADMIAPRGIVYGRRDLRSGAVPDPARFLIRPGGYVPLIAAGDLNGDGRADLLGGNENYGGCPEGDWCYGRAWVVWGQSPPRSFDTWPTAAMAKPMSADDGTTICSTGNGGFGRGVAAPGNLDGVGPADPVVLDEYDSATAVLDVPAFACKPAPDDWDAPDSSWKLPPAVVWELDAETIAGLGDTDGDGRDDVVTAIATRDERIPAAYLRLGHPPGDFPKQPGTPRSPADGHRYVLAEPHRNITGLYTAGDVNGDGRGDLLVETGHRRCCDANYLPSTRYTIVLGAPGSPAVRLAGAGPRVVRIR